MNSLNTFFTKAKTFFLTYKWLLIPLVPIVLFIYFIIVIIASNPTKTPISNHQGTKISVSPSDQAELTPQEDRPYGLYNEVQGIAFGKHEVLTGNTHGNSGEGYGTDNEFADTSISNKTFSDGSIAYEYQSADPQRPHMQIVKNGVVLFRRNLMPDDTTTDYYSSYLQNPEYTSQGSSYFGPNAMIYASPKNGIAIVFNPQNKQVYEQYLFPAISVTDYLKKFGPDISAFNPGP